MSNNDEILNITRQNVTGPCDLKCAYSFNYPESSSTATNYGGQIGLTYDNGSSPPVLFNNKKYSVINTIISAPSMLLYDGNRAPAEILIEHETSGGILLVYIPIVSSTNSSNASNLITQVIESVTNNAPRSDETTNLNISGFTFNDIVPNKPYYFANINNAWNYVFFDLANAIPISSSVLDSLAKIINTPQTSPDNLELFYNSKGVNSSSGNGVGEGIYISCQPTGASTETTNVSFPKIKDPTSLNFSTFTSNPNTIFIINVIVGCAIFIVLLLIVNFGYGYLTTHTIKMPSLPMGNHGS